MHSGTYRNAEKCSLIHGWINNLKYFLSRKQASTIVGGSGGWVDSLSNCRILAGESPYQVTMCNSIKNFSDGIKKVILKICNC